MHTVIIDYDCHIGKWQVCQPNGMYLDVIAEFKLISDAVSFCQKNGFNWR